MNGMEKNKKIIRLIESTLDEIKMDKNLSESKFSRVANTMRGLVPSIKTIAIMTAENPYAVKQSDEYNKEANLKLMMDLKNGQYGYRPVLGQYGNKENSFIVNNISIGDAIRLGEKYKQESIVFGKRIEEEDGYVGMKFNLIRTIGEDKGRSEGEMNVFVNLENPDDYYSEYKGRKFVIPFYGITKMIIDMEEKKKLITKQYDDVTWDGGKVTPSDISIEDVDEIEKLQESAMKSVGSSAYHKRGILRKKLRSMGLE
jgi:hypothetical protein